MSLTNKEDSLVKVQTAYDSLEALHTKLEAWLGVDDPITQTAMQRMTDMEEIENDLTVWKKKSRIIKTFTVDSLISKI